MIDSQIALARQTFVTTNTKAVVESQQQVDQLTQELAKANDMVDHMTLTAPIAGTVQATAVTTIGQVVTTGQQLMQIVPKGTPVEIEAYILNSDAGFVKVGQDVTIKVDTFPYTRYGTISGRVEKVATDALTGKEAAAQQSNPSTPSSADGAMSTTSAAQQTSDLVFPVIIRPLVPGLKGRGSHAAADIGNDRYGRDPDGKPSSHRLHPIPTAVLVRAIGAGTMRRCHAFRSGWFSTMIASCRGSVGIRL